MGGRHRTFEKTTSVFAPNLFSISLVWKPKPPLKTMKKSTIHRPMSNICTHIAPQVSLCSLGVMWFQLGARGQQHTTAVAIHMSLALMDNVDLPRRPMIRRMTSVVGTTMQMAAVTRKPTCPGSSIGIVWEDMLCLSSLWLPKRARRSQDSGGVTASRAAQVVSPLGKLLDDSDETTALAGHRIYRLWPPKLHETAACRKGLEDGGWDGPEHPGNVAAYPPTSTDYSTSSSHTYCRLLPPPTKYMEEAETEIPALLLLHH